MDIQPPKWADRFLAWYCNPDLLEEIQGDAHELYFQRVKNEGKSSADWKYIWDVIRFCRWSNIKTSTDELKPGYLGVLWNLNLKIALRHAVHNKIAFSIKVFGLSICLAFALVIAAFVIQEFTFDRHHADYEKIFRVGAKVGLHGVITNYAVSPLALGDGMEEEIPEVETAFRFMFGGNPVFTVEDNLFNGETTLIPCEDFLKVLSFDFIQGTTDALDEPNKIVLTESTAHKFFGEKDPLGQTVNLPWTQLEVAAVIKDVPVSSHLRFDALISWDTYDFNDSWSNINAYTYFKMKSGADIKPVRSKINELFLNHTNDIKGSSAHRHDEEISISPIVDNIADIHLSEFRDEDIAVKRDRTNLNILIVVVILFFLTGVINFYNLSLAELTTNVRKIGILRVFGGSTANHGKVIVTNTLLSMFVILPITGVLSYASLLMAEDYFSISVARSVFTSFWFMIVLSGSFFLFIFSAKVNAFVLSRTNNIIDSLKGKVTLGYEGIRSRELLVAMQLAFSIIMIALITIIVDQFNYVNGVDKGFEDKNTIVIKMLNDDFSTAQTFQESLRKLNGIKKVDGGSFYLDNVETKEFFEVETENGRKNMLVTYMECGYDYLDVMGIKVTKGRNFNVDFSTDNFGAYIINETAAREFGWKDPIGKSIWGPLGTDRDEGQIIGVVKDFNFASLHSKIAPLIIFPASEGWGIRYVYVKTDPIRPSNLMAQIGLQYKKLYDDLPLEWEFLDSKYASLYQNDYEVKNVFQVGLVISILLSSLGIFGMSALLVIIRAKEMGIRKVVGADQIQLFTLHLHGFIKFILIAVVIAWPIAYYLSVNWLDNFAYHIELNLWYFILPCFVALIIVVLTSGYHGLKSARVNPVDILKNE
ncbi:ABC transporter permease [Chryseolinea sp. H1M3-3]|uniref:ABC transporter permease n=1 Tax=Chryseolinea sp. H1M3-3 TaxID=3034144 RepID=UPI0023ED787A|nr:ABC transporter permease [Chryseolinea sp. H1M3-3]